MSVVAEAAAGRVSSVTRAASRRSWRSDLIWVASWRACRGVGEGGVSFAGGGVSGGEGDEHAGSGADEVGGEVGEGVGEVVDGVGFAEAGEGVAAPSGEVGSGEEEVRQVGVFGIDRE